MRPHVVNIGTGARPLRSRGGILAVDRNRVAVVRRDREPRFGRRRSQWHHALKQHRCRRRLHVRIGRRPDPFRRQRQDLQLAPLEREVAVQFSIGLRIIHPRERHDRVGKLLGTQPPHRRTAKNKMLLCLADIHRRELVGARGQNAGHRVLQIVTMRGEILREPVHQRRRPRGPVHLVDGLDEAVTHEALPHAVDDRARQAAVRATSDHVSELAFARGRVGPRVDQTDFLIEKFYLADLPGGFVALGNFQRAIGVDARETVRIFERVFVDKTVVARGTLQIHAEKHLRDAVRRLHRRHHAGVDGAPPRNAVGKALGLGAGIDELRDEHVVGQIPRERRVEPVGDRFAPAIDVAGAFIVVSQEVIPKRQPVLGVALVVGEQTLHQSRALVGCNLGDKRF